MSATGRWELCVEHRDSEAARFVQDYFGDANRRVGFIAAAGFDARSCHIADLLAKARSKVEAYFIREERFVAEPSLLTRADANMQKMQEALPTNKVLRIQVFGEGNAVVGGRAIAAKFNQLRAEYEQWTDVVIDASALSVGISYPLIRFFLERADRGEPRNVHAFLSADAGMDDGVVPIASDIMTTVHGFSGGLTLHELSRAARLWLPQLATGRKAMLDTVYRAIKPEDVCPILPFPSADPRRADGLIAHYLEEFQSIWEVDARDIIYAAENDPKDLYQTLRRLHQLRKSVFEEAGGSVVVLSPMGNKALALGALMAAYELDFTVAYVESEGFDPKTIKVATVDSGSSGLIHLWLAGDVYTDLEAEMGSAKA